MNLKSKIEKLDMFTNEKYPNSIFYRKIKNNEIVFEYNIVNKIAFVNFGFFNLDYNQIDLFKKKCKEFLKIDIVKIIKNKSISEKEFELIKKEYYNEKSIITL